MPRFNPRKIIVVILVAAFLLSFFAYFQQQRLVSIYLKQISPSVQDRQGKIFLVEPNPRGYYSYPLKQLPPRLAELLVAKEDQSFYWHFGLNPKSLLESLLGRLGLGNRQASSTITQQLVKVLLGHESDRTWQNKIEETIYAFSLEAFQRKTEILKMYADSIYFGNLAQGIFEASRFYFDADPETLGDGQILQLLATISSPTDNNPTSAGNQTIALSLAGRLGLDEKNLVFVAPKEARENLQKTRSVDPLSFELGHFLLKDDGFCQVTLDQPLNAKVREIVQESIRELKFQDAHNAAVVVLRLPENEVLSLVGSVDPSSQEAGDQINMIFEPRPIGSTVKSFIYLKAFEKGLRPYTLVDDREYKYITALGFPLYPKNYDYQYRGLVKLNYALSNSLNVPAVKVLEYVGLDDFYQFWEKELGFNPNQPWSNYQLGIALGGLEMNLWDLARYFTIFPNQGWLKDVKVFQSGSCFQSKPEKAREIAQPGFIQLVNKVLNDRQTGMEQFGMRSEFNLFQNNYALKTGTSRDFKDSWVVGYTPDFLVGVWVGNADNSPTDQVSGQQGAGQIWSKAMELLLNSRYNKKTPFDFSLVKNFQSDQSLDWGLKGDDYQKIQNLLLEKDSSLILLPHDNDSFLLEPNARIILRASQEVDWFVRSETSFEKFRFLGRGQEQIFIPQFPGQYQIKAQSPTGQSKETTIFLNE